MATLWGSASLHFTPRKWWAGRPYVGRRRRPWGRGQPAASRWRSAARGAAAVPTCLPGQEPVSRSRHARSKSDGRVAALTGARNCAKTAQTRRHISELPGDIDRVHPAKSKGTAPGRRFLHRAGMHGVALSTRVRQEQPPRICNRRTDRVSWSEAASTPASTRRPARTPQINKPWSIHTHHPSARSARGSSPAVPAAAARRSCGERACRRAAAT